MIDEENNLDMRYDHLYKSITYYLIGYSYISRRHGCRENLYII